MLGVASSTISSVRPSAENASDDGPGPKGASSSKIAIGGEVTVAALERWTAYWQTGAPFTVMPVQEGFWRSTQASSDGFAGSGAGSARWGSVTVAVSDQAVPIVLAPRARW